MRAGLLTELIELQRETHSVDDYGTAVLSWTPYAFPRAQVVKIGAKEFIEAAGAITKPAVVFRVRYRQDVKIGDRVSYDERAYSVIETRELGRREGLELQCLSSGL